MSYSRSRWFLVLTFLFGSTAFGLTTYYVAPDAAGAGNGSSSANAAYYASATLWDNVKNSLANDEVKVVFADSNLYGSNTTSYPALTFVNVGNPLKKLTLSGTSQANTKWNYVSSAQAQPYFLKLEGCQNITIEKMTFKGDNDYSTSKWGVSLDTNNKKPCRNITIDQCTFFKLVTVEFGALGISNGTRDVAVTNCTFDRVGVSGTTTGHMIYGVRAQNVLVDGCSFIDCYSGSYLKVRNDSDYWTVRNSAFTSTQNICDPGNNDNVQAFIDICALNSSADNFDPVDPSEYFGYHYKVHNCSFTAYSAANNNDALNFRGAGYDPYGLFGTRLTATEGGILEGTNIASQRDVLWENINIRAGKVIMYSNTLTRLRHQGSYTYQESWGSGNNGWVSSADIDETFTSTAGTELEAVGCIVNGNFEKAGYPSRYWCYNQLNPVPHAGLNGTTTALFLDAALGNHQVWQWLSQTGTTWQAEVCFALGAFTGSGEKFRLDLVHQDLADGKVSLGINSSGQIGLYNGTTFNVLTALGTIGFSVDGNGDGDYADAGDTLRWYHVRITGDYAGATPSVSVQLSDQNTYALNAAKLVTGRTDFVNGAPVAGSSRPTTIVFQSTACDVVLDEIAVQ